MSIQSILLFWAPLPFVSVRRPSVTSTIDVLRNQWTLPPASPVRPRWPSRFILYFESVKFASPATRRPWLRPLGPAIPLLPEPPEACIRASESYRKSAEPVLLRMRILEVLSLSQPYDCPLPRSPNLLPVSVR